MPDCIISGSLQTTIIDLMRHGEPVGGRKYRGQQNDPLSNMGWQQMREAVAEKCPWNVIISSSLSRCNDFAEELAQRHNIPLISDNRLIEIGFGAWEGYTAKELQQQDPNILYRFWSDPEHNTPPGAESMLDFQNRVIGAWEDFSHRYRGQHLLLVAHAGVIRMILRHVLEMPLTSMYRIKVPSAGISRICIDHTPEQSLPVLMFHGGRI